MKRSAIPAVHGAGFRREAPLPNLRVPTKPIEKRYYPGQTRSRALLSSLSMTPGFSRRPGIGQGGPGRARVGWGRAKLISWSFTVTDFVSASASTHQPSKFALRRSPAGVPTGRLCYSTRLRSRPPDGTAFAKVLGGFYAVLRDLFAQPATLTC